MNRFLVLFSGASAIALAGCANINTSQAPVPITYPKAFQRKMQAAHHWSLLAEYEAGLIVGAIKDLNKPIYIECVAVGCANNSGNSSANIGTPFNQAYHSMLQSQLVKKGATVVTNPVTNSVNVSYIAQVLEHKDRGYVVWEPGVFAAPPTHQVTDDVPFWSYKTIDPTEVIITTQVTEGALLLHSGTDIFYYNKGDTEHYFNKYPRYANITFKVIDNAGDIHEGL